MIGLIGVYSQGCQAGSIRQRLSALQAAATSWPTLLSVPSKALRLVSRAVMAVTALPTVLMIASPSFCSTCKLIIKDRLIVYY